MSQLPSLYLDKTVKLGQQGIQIFVGCDERHFFNYVIPLAVSLEINAPYNSLHIHIYNLNKPILYALQQMRSGFQRTVISWSHESVELPNNGKHRFIYYSSMRFVRLFQLVRIFKSVPIYFMDADSLVMKPLGQLPSHVSLCDISVITRFYEEIDNMKFLASAIYWQPTPKSYAYLKAIAHHIEQTLTQNQPTIGGLDQLCMYQAYLQHQDIQIKPFPSEYVDWRFNDESYVWTGKGNRKRENEKFINKLEAYKKMVAGLYQSK
ncbi:hypothetical protein [Candidatus Albibeggiatoa sp. nov. NOAA]|uniref:hypothetical protein n=1 Tax=Candidatus Albibeggiatoa sp. nov. NOAA TaxID=3162724 RepID=UPI0032F0B19F|nr:hypothetical protein [Thiotrichaceae bacterium]